MNTVSSKHDAFHLLAPKMSTDVEEVWAICLGPGLQIIDHRLIFRGTVDRCLIHPREILRSIILSNATSFILAHNHPSGDLTPSIQDITFTKKMKKIGQLIEIKMIDHIILGKGTFISMRDLNFF